MNGDKGSLFLPLLAGVTISTLFFFLITASVGKELMSSAEENLQIATLAGGCFWCVEAVYESLEGVQKAESGYAGGKLPNPTYEDISYKETGHAEVVNVSFDPKVISYEDLLEVFFHTHDPTTLNRQGADVGTQYRSIIFYRDEKQRVTAEAVKKRIQSSGLWKDPIVTEIVPFDVFYKAEDYHQNYFATNPTQPYCSMVIAPKLQKLYKTFAAKLKKKR